MRIHLSPNECEEVWLLSHRRLILGQWFLSTLNISLYGMHGVVVRTIRLGDVAILFDRN